jgi:hypothetical protein
MRDLSISQSSGGQRLKRLLDRCFRILAELISELRQDVRYGLRMLAGSSGFTAVAVMSLSLGIAVITCAYSEINGLILRDVPGLPHPDELLALAAPTSYPQYKRYSERSDVFSATLAYVAPVPFGVSLESRTERVWGHLVTPSYFTTLGVHPALGHFVDQAAHSTDVVVSYRFWQEHLGADPSSIGKPLRVNGQARTIIGVGPKDFLGASPGLFVADIWLPASKDLQGIPELADNALERPRRSR